MEPETQSRSPSWWQEPNYVGHYFFWGSILAGGWSQEPKADINPDTLIKGSASERASLTARPVVHAWSFLQIKLKKNVTWALPHVLQEKQR